jgi:hypothetical protein
VFLKSSYGVFLFYNLKCGKKDILQHATEKNNIKLNDVFFKFKNLIKNIKGKSLQIQVVENAIYTTFFDHILSF